MEAAHVFLWPDPLNPKFVTRDFTLVKDGEDPIAVSGMKLIQLVADCLYEVPESESKDETPRGLRPGCILSRNLRLTELITGGEEEKQQCFVSYDGVYQARRGLGHADRRGHAHEIPDLKSWSGSLEEMVRMSWKLRKNGEGELTRFSLVAATEAGKRGSVIDPRKVAALGRTRQAGSVIDSKGRFNPGRIPLICFAGQNQIANRIQAVRGIGRHMSFREAVLEHYIDRLREICREVMLSQEYRLSQRWLAESKRRTPQKVRTEAKRLQDAAVRLRKIKTRPFCRSLARAADDLDEAARLLKEAAEEKEASKIAQAKSVIGRVYRSMRMIAQHWRLEEMMVQCAIVQDRGEEVVGLRKQMWYSELRSIRFELTRVDRVTGKKLEEGFARPVLARVLPHLNLAILALMRKRDEGSTDLKTMYSELRDACSPM